MKLLIIEDDPSIYMGLEIILKDENYETKTANDGEIGYQLALKEVFNLIILDVMLPNKNGFEICRDLRKSGIKTPILFLTSKKEEFDKIIGFESGADDYLTKPFSISELKLRVKAILRRVNHSSAAQEEMKLTIDDLLLDYEQYDVFRNGISLGLSVKEFQILKLFIENTGKILTRDKILDKVWGYDTYPTSRTVDNYILSLRKKIEPDPSNPKYIHTVPKLGYKFNANFDNNI